MNALTAAIGHREQFPQEKARDRKSLGYWIVNRLRSRSEGVARLRVLEQLKVTPRNGLALIEVSGERFLMATSDGSAPAIFPIKNSAAVSEIRIEGSCV
jgi:flagellar biogenesis protein FliO